MQNFEKLGDFFKADDQGIIYGWAIVCTEAGVPYVDLQGDYIPVSAMLDAAADFAKHSRVGKDMHEGGSVGEHLFLYPITKSSADLGVTSTREGLLVGFKPNDPKLLDLVRSGERTGFSIGGTLSDSVEEDVGKSAFAKGATAGAKTRRTFRTFKISEISLVDRPAQEGATVGYVKRARVIARRAKVRKDVVLTSLEAGHQHTVDLEDPLCGYSDSLSTSYQTAEGADNCHSHAWIFDATTGAVTIAADSGHTHTIGDAVPAAVLTAAAAIDAQEDARAAAVPAAVADEPSDVIPCAVEAEESSGANVNVTIVQARAPISVEESKRAKGAIDKSTHPAPAPHGGSMNDADRIKQLETDNATLSKRADRAGAVSKLNDAQRAHFATLTGSDADAFLAKSDLERAAVVKSIADADTIEHTGEDGTVYRKSAGAQVIALAKSLTEANKLAKAERDARQVEIYKARAKADIGNLAGTEDTKVALLKSIDTIADQPTRDLITATLKSGNAAMAMLGVAKGSSDGSVTDGDPFVAYTKGLETFAKSKDVKNPLDAQDAFLKTDEGKALKKNYDATRAYAQR